MSAQREQVQKQEVNKEMIQEHFRSGKDGIVMRKPALHLGKKSQVITWLGCLWKFRYVICKTDNNVIS